MFFAIVIFFVGVYVLQRSNHPQFAATNFIDQLDGNEISKAYVRTASAFQEQISPEEFGIFVASYQPKSDTLEWDWLEKTKTFAKLGGSIVVNQEQYPITVSMTKEDGEWRVTNIDLR